MYVPKPILNLTLAIGTREICIPCRRSSISVHLGTWSRNVWCSSRSSLPVSKYRLRCIPERRLERARRSSRPCTAAAPAKVTVSTTPLSTAYLATFCSKLWILSTGSSSTDFFLPLSRAPWASFSAHLSIGVGNVLCTLYSTSWNNQSWYITSFSASRPETDLYCVWTRFGA